jgi:hypothetical protein
VLAYVPLRVTAGFSKFSLDLALADVDGQSDNDARSRSRLVADYLLAVSEFGSVERERRRWQLTN